MMLNMKFMEYVSIHNKSYLTTEEFEVRKTLFATVDTMIKEHNATDSLYTMGHNMFSDWTKDEKKRFNGYKANPNVKVEELELDETVGTPASYDWRDYNAVTPVE